MEADVCSDDELERALDVAAAGRGRGKGSMVALEANGKGIGRGKRCNNNAQAGSSGRIATATSLAIKILPTVGSEISRRKNLDVPAADENWKQGGLRFSTVGILRGCFGAEDSSVSCTNITQAALSALLSDRSAMAY